MLVALLLFSTVFLAYTNGANDNFKGVATLCQGFSANLVTSFLVIVASKYGVPVSTTHVSVGSIFGIGMVSQNQNAVVIRSILLSWVITLPIAMAFSASIYWLVS